MSGVIGNILYLLVDYEELPAPTLCADESSVV